MREDPVAGKILSILKEGTEVSFARARRSPIQFHVAVAFDDHVSIMQPEPCAKLLSRHSLVELERSCNQRCCSPGGGSQGISCTYLIVEDPTAMSHPPTSSMSSWLSLHYGPDQMLEVGWCGSCSLVTVLIGSCLQTLVQSPMESSREAVRCEETL